MVELRMTTTSDNVGGDVYGTGGINTFDDRLGSGKSLSANRRCAIEGSTVAFSNGKLDQTPAVCELSGTGNTRIIGGMALEDYDAEIGGSTKDLESVDLTFLSKASSGSKLESSAKMWGVALSCLVATPVVATQALAVCGAGAMACNMVCVSGEDGISNITPDSSSVMTGGMNMLVDTDMANSGASVGMGVRGALHSHIGALAPPHMNGFVNDNPYQQQLDIANGLAAAAKQDRASLASRNSDISLFSDSFTPEGNGSGSINGLLHVKVCRSNSGQRWAYRVSSRKPLGDNKRNCTPLARSGAGGGMKEFFHVWACVSVTCHGTKTVDDEDADGILGGYDSRGCDAAGGDEEHEAFSEGKRGRGRKMRFLTGTHHQHAMTTKDVPMGMSYTSLPLTNNDSANSCRHPDVVISLREGGNESTLTALGPTWTMDEEPGCDGYEVSDMWLCESIASGEAGVVDASLEGYRGEYIDLACVLKDSPCGKRRRVVVRVWTNKIHYEVIEDGRNKSKSKMEIDKSDESDAEFDLTGMCEVDKLEFHRSVSLVKRKRRVAKCGSIATMATRASLGSLRAAGLSSSCRSRTPSQQSLFSLSSSANESSPSMTRIQSSSDLTQLSLRPRQTSHLSTRTTLSQMSDKSDDSLSSSGSSWSMSVPNARRKDRAILRMVTRRNAKPSFGSDSPTKNVVYFRGRRLAHTSA